MHQIRFLVSVRLSVQMEFDTMPYVRRQLEDHGLLTDLN